MSVDPDLAETGEPYVYAGDDPVNAADPSGDWLVYLGISHGLTPDAAENFVETLLSPWGVVQPKVVWNNAPYGYWNGSTYKVLGYGQREIDVTTRHPWWINEVKTGPNVTFLAGNNKYAFQAAKDGGLVAAGNFYGGDWWFFPGVTSTGGCSKSGPDGNLLAFLTTEEHLNVLVFVCNPDADDSLYSKNRGESDMFLSNSFPFPVYQFYPSPPLSYLSC
jgi:hypothetical protein